MKYLKKILITTITLFLVFLINAQETEEEVFTIINKIPTTPIVNQYRSNTCWSYTTLGLFETELIKERHQECQLSKMFIVYYTYIDKAELYIRMHGKINFSSGGALNDVFYIIQKYGIVPYDVYKGTKNGNLPDHIQMEALLLSYLNDLIKKNQIPKDWKNRFIEILDEYMGAPPVKFTYEGKEYTPITFANSLKIKETNYALFSSFEYKSYYKKHIVEVPDNWLMKKAYNLPLDEMMKIIDNALNMGFPVAITCDITERGYVWKDGIALVVTKENIDDFLYNDVFGKNAKPINEPDITSTMRQEAFDNYQTTDDHSILIVGTAKDKYGKKYYYAKNSWGTENTAYKGYIYMSESYIRYKTLTILVNKITVPKDILNKYESECN